jgi:hypothetical protein
VTSSAGGIELAVPFVIWLISSRIEIARRKFENSHYRRKPGTIPVALGSLKASAIRSLAISAHAAEVRPATSSTVWITGRGALTTSFSCKLGKPTR